ncbi:hypothetical protein C2845_PM04G16650 [Panicum miliaceum]|uniref:Uncharacterized protein n=1 Tax=Panicum miliaceum TaxID=4540 RepID=A0A3L6QMH6_PANMI|nr:hypothetical protein C2845_PM04G16650 [Panicum miliaceum]
MVPIEAHARGASGAGKENGLFGPSKAQPGHPASREKGGGGRRVRVRFSPSHHQPPPPPCPPPPFPRPPAPLRRRAGLGQRVLLHGGGGLLLLVVHAVREALGRFAVGDVYPRADETRPPIRRRRRILAGGGLRRRWGCSRSAGAWSGVVERSGSAPRRHGAAHWSTAAANDAGVVEAKRCHPRSTETRRSRCQRPRRHGMKSRDEIGVGAAWFRCGGRRSECRRRRGKMAWWHFWGRDVVRWRRHRDLFLAWWKWSRVRGLAQGRRRWGRSLAQDWLRRSRDGRPIAWSGDVVVWRWALRMQMTTASDAHGVKTTTTTTRTSGADGNGKTVASLRQCVTVAWKA